MLVIPLWPSLAHHHGAAPTPVQQLALLKTDFAREVLPADGLALGLGSTAWRSEGSQTFLKLCHISSDSRINVIIPAGLAVASSQSLTGLVSSSGRDKGQSSETN